MPDFTTAGKIQAHDIIEIPLLSDAGIISEIVPLYQSGHSIPEISKITGIPRTSIRGYLLQAGISLHGKNEGPSVTIRRPKGQVRWNSPYGFKYLRGELVAHPQEFETLRLILKWSTETMSYANISTRLNDQKLRPRSANAWTRFTVRQVIKWH